MSQEQKINEIFEIVLYLRDNMIMKKDFERKVDTLKDDLAAHIDGLVARFS